MLTLRHTGFDNAEDFQINDDGRGVGRIYSTSSGFRGDGFAWFVYGSSRKGFAASLDAAKAEWKAAYDGHRDAMAVTP